MKIIKIGIVFIVCMAMASCEEAKPQRDRLNLTKEEGASLLRQIKGCENRKDETCETYLERPEVIYHIVFYGTDYNKVKHAIKNGYINLQDPPHSGGSGHSSGTKSGDLSYGSGGIGVSTGNGFQYNLSDGHIGPSWGP